MTINEISSEIEGELNFLDNEKILEVATIVAPEESIGIIDNDEIKEDIIQIIIEKVEYDDDLAETVYSYLFDEKISIDKEKQSFYENEEFE